MPRHQAKNHKCCKEVVKSNLLSHITILTIYISSATIEWE